MNKQEFLNKLSHEELILLRDIISPHDIADEIENRIPKKELNVKVGDCFIYKENPDELYLIKVIGEGDNNWFNCYEISIDNHNINYCYDHCIIDECSDWEPLDPNVYEKVYANIKARDEAVKKIIKEFDKQIRELCLTLLNTQNKS